MEHSLHDYAASSALLDDLTDPQRQAVTTTEGPLLVLAAAGSGKTRVITRRVAYLVQQIDVPPWQVLAITFTNKATGEMRDRVAQLLTERQARAVTISTFHALCARLLREYSERVALPMGYSIYDAADQRRVMRQVLKDLDVSTSNFTPDTLLSSISNAKNELTDADDYARQASDFYQKIVARVYTRYEQTLRKNSAVDFDDLLFLTARLLRHDEAVQADLQRRFSYVLIDEYQDTNHAQFVIAHALAAAHQNICVVGDPDQSIYGWRGANISNILDFEQHYADATVIKLGQNYRSTPQILQAADGLIRHNTQRRHKDLWTANPDGPPIRLVKLENEEQEARHIADWFTELKQTGLTWGQMVVFYRVNALSRVLEEAFMGRAIPYQIARGTAFYQRQEVKDALAYLRVLINEADEVALLRIINTPTRGLGNTTIRQIQAHASAHGLTLWAALRRAGDLVGLTARARNAAQRFVSMFEQWREKLQSTGETLMGYQAGVRDVIEMILRDSGLEGHFKKQDEKEGHDEQSKSANLGELVTAAQRFDMEYGETDTDMTRRVMDYLESVSLVSDVDAVSASEGSVTLMTLHAAKGLEYPAVAMIGLEEGLLPHSRSTDSAAEMEEERRLCFVGMTRAQQHLMLTQTRYRTMRGQLERSISSAFLRELPTEPIVEEDLSDTADQSDWTGPATKPDEPFVPSWGRRPKKASGAGPVTRPSKDSTAAFPPGTMVRHPQFGLGEVESVSGAGVNARAKVRFFDAGVKTLVLEYARLDRIGG